MSSHTQYEEASESLGDAVEGTESWSTAGASVDTICYSPYYRFLTYRPHRTCLLKSSSVRPG